MAPDVSLLAAFVAGVLSITSPCVLPLIPLYLTHLAGVAAPDDTPESRKRLVLNALAYVAGFSLVFVALGIAFGAAGSLVSAATIVSSNRFWLVRLGGALLILLGLHQIGLVRIPFLEQEHRFRLAHRRGAGQLTSSFLIGVTFAAGWSPCAGPILGAILTMAAGQGSPERSALLLAGYSLGLAIPFLMVALFGSASAILRALGPRLQAVTSVSGAVMLAIGILMIMGIYQQFFTRLVAAAPWTPWEPTL